MTSSNVRMERMVSFKKGRPNHRQFVFRGGGGFQSFNSDPGGAERGLNSFLYSHV